MLRNVVFWSLFPLVVPQALYVRKTAPRFAGAEGATEGVVGNGRMLRLIAIGDSIIAGVGAASLPNALVGQTARTLAESLDCQVNWVARGKIGAESDKILAELVPALPVEAADFIILSAGVNDVTTLVSESTWARNLGELLAVLRRHSPYAVIAVPGMPPLKDFPLLPQPLRALLGLRAETLDDVTRRVVAAAHPQTIYVSVDHVVVRPEKFAADGYHPSEMGYQEFGRLMAEAIIRCRPSSPSTL